MFKLVVLFSAVCALAAGKPSGALFAAPLAYTSTFYSPATTLTKTSTVLHPAPLYQAPTFISGAHFIKKRSAIAPLAYGPAFLAPAAYSSQSRIDFPAKTIYTAAATPIVTHYSAPLAYAHHF